MDLKKLFTLAAIPALALTLTACGGKKPAASGSAAPAASAEADKGKVAEEIKTYVATYAPELKEFDDANQCFVAKSGADKYCMVPQSTARVDMMYRDHNKTKINYVFLTSKGKYVKGELDTHADGGFAAITSNKDTGELVQKVPFTKAWSASKQYSVLCDKWERRTAHFTGNRLGKEIGGVVVDEEKVTAWPQDEKPGVFISGADRKTSESRTWYLLEGKEFRKIGKLRTAYQDVKAKIINHVNTAFLTASTDEATGWYVKKIDIRTNINDVKGEQSFELKYNPAKKAYDIPVEVRKIMKEQ